VEPITDDITLHRGASWRRQYTLARSADPLDAYDLTGCEARLEIRPKAGSETLLISISELVDDDGQITLGGTDGTISIYLSPAATLKLNVKSAAWDLFLEWPSGIDVDKIVMGAVAIDPNVTDPTYD
jgi:hypothetical protein